MVALPCALVLLGLVGGAGAAEVSDADDRFVETRAGNLPGKSELNMSVQMLGFEVEGTHVLGHLVKVDNPVGRVSVALPPGGCGTREYTTVTSQKHEPKCRLAINAGYFNVTDAACIGNLVADGVVVQTVPLDQSNVNFGIRGGKIAFGYFTPEEIQGFEQLVSGVTWLVRDGKSYVEQGWAEANITVQTSGDKYVSNLGSRTAVGVDKDGRLIIMQIDGSIPLGHNKRGDLYRGVNMYQLADLLIDHGAVHAINLDGGGSSAMARDGMLINYPSDRQPPSCDASGKYQCERPVSTLLCIHELPEVSWLSTFQVSSGQTASQGSGSSALPLAAVGVVFFVAGCGAFFGLGMLCGGKTNNHKKARKESDRESEFARQISETSVSSTSDAPEHGA